MAIKSYEKGLFKMNKFFTLILLIILSINKLFCPESSTNQGERIANPEVFFRDELLVAFHDLYFYKFCFRAKQAIDQTFQTLVFSTNIDRNCKNIIKCADKDCYEDSYKNDSGTTIPFCQKHIAMPFDQEHPEWTNERLFNYWKTRIANPIQSQKALKPYLKDEISPFFLICKTLYQDLDRYFEAILYQAKIERMHKTESIKDKQIFNVEIIKLLKKITISSKNEAFRKASKIKSNQTAEVVKAIKKASTSFLKFELTPVPAKTKPMLKKRRKASVARIIAPSPKVSDFSTGELTPGAAERSLPTQTQQTTPTRVPRLPSLPVSTRQNQGKSSARTPSSVPQLPPLAPVRGGA